MTQRAGFPSTMEAMGAATGRSGHALVVGASIAGLLAARVLQESFDRVTVVDRDELPDSPVTRRGVPQAVHSHGLLARGREILEELYPGITARLVEQGAILSDMQRQNRFVAEGGPIAAAPSDIRAVAVSRQLLEHEVRAHTAALPGVTIRDRCEVIGLTTKDGTAVTGIRLRRVDSGGGRDAGDGQSDGPAAEEAVPADLVVDATGRSNRGPTWLREIGYDAPPEDVVRSGGVYVTREYRRTAADGDRVATVVAMTPALPRGAGVIAAEGDRWVCTLVGMNEHAPPVEPEAFEAFAATLPTPDVHDMMRRSEPLSEVVRMRLAPSTRRRYERLARVPDGFVAIGDSLCHFNPTYGQGMAIAALEAIALRDALRHGRAGLPRRYFRSVAKGIDLPWQTSAMGDLRFPWVEGRRTRAFTMFNRYFTRITRASADDPRVAYTFLRVMNLLAPPATLFGPRMVVRVLRRRPRPAAEKAQAQS